MRKQDTVTIWPAYFDSAKSRKEGRRINKNLAVTMPKATEIKEAADRLHLTSELVPDKGYAKAAWLRTGMVLIKKGREPKESIVQKIARQLQRARMTASPKS